MVFDDESTASVKRSANFSTGKTIGFILKTQRDFGGEMKLGVYIPKMMMAIDAKNGAWEKSLPIKKTKIKNAENGNFGDSSLKIQNYVTLPPFVNMGVSMPRYKKGEKVIVDTIDSDIKTLAVLPYSTYTADERETDVISWFVPARRKGATGPLTEANCYVWKLDSDKKLVALYMADEGGTLLPFTFGYDQQNKKFFMSDSKRVLTMEADTDMWHIENEAKSVIEMKGDLIAFKSKNYSIEAETSVKIVTDKYSLEAKEITEKADKATIIIEEVTAEYAKLMEKIDKWEASGSSTLLKFDKAKIEASIIVAAGKLAASQGIYFTDGSENVMPTAAYITADGKGFISSPSMAAFPVVLAPFLTPILLEMAAKIDVTMALVGSPPTTVTSVNGQVQSMQSKTLNG